MQNAPRGSIRQYFRPSLSNYLSLKTLFFLFLSGHFTQVLLYIAAPKCFWVMQFFFFYRSYILALKKSTTFLNKNMVEGTGSCLFWSSRFIVCLTCELKFLKKYIRYSQLILFIILELVKDRNCYKLVANHSLIY